MYQHLITLYRANIYLNLNHLTFQQRKTSEQLNERNRYRHSASTNDTEHGCR